VVKAERPAATVGRTIRYQVHRTKQVTTLDLDTAAGLQLLLRR
jgi:hypothetical protein